MASLLSLGRHRHQERDAASAPSRSWNNPFRSRSGAPSPDTVVEMNSTTAPADQNPDLEQGTQRSFPGFGFGNRNRNGNQTQQQQQAYMAPYLGNNHNNHLGGGFQPGTFGAGSALSALLLAPMPMSTNTVTRSGRKPRSNRREREEAATLFGPNLANYFGSGNSSSGAISGTGLAQVVSLAGGAPTSDSQQDNSASADAMAARRGGRLGSRGRARGTSLSGLSMMSLGAESVNSLGGVQTDPTVDATPAQGMMHGSTADLIDQLRTGPAGDITMSEGIDIDTLKNWIDRSVGVPSSAANPATPAPPVCTTLQSYVNLKRNTLKLSLKSQTAGESENLLRSRPSTAQLGSTLPGSTHTLFFEYDCAAPFASVQIFVRASRKHGSWLNFDTPESDPIGISGHPLMLAQRGPPPHVLGWPVHVAQIKSGYGSAHTTSLPLNLQYFAPPRSSKGDAKTEKLPKVPEAAVTPAAVPETPGFEFQRRLELDVEDAEEDPAPLPTRIDIEAEQTVPAEETKEQRLAREKTERETLKVAIVVEALDENARPLRDPNLQTTYLRITSLPTRKPVTERLADAALHSPVAIAHDVPERTWSLQVEGQEAEIGPHRFQLQELYGLSSKPPPVRAAPVGGEDGEAEEDGAVGDTTTTGAGAGSGAFLAAMDMEESNGTECLICLSSPPTTLLLPCTHGLCLECAVQLRDSVIGIRQTERRRGRTPRRKYACPVCRRAYTSMLHLSKTDEKALAQATPTIP